MTATWQSRPSEIFDDYRLGRVSDAERYAMDWGLEGADTDDSQPAYPPVPDTHIHTQGNTHMKRTDAFPSTYLSKDDVSTPILAHIENVSMATLKSDDGDERKPVMHFREDLKGLILNNTNWTICEDAYGNDTDLWTGKPVELYHDPNIMFGKKRVGGIRIRIPAQTVNGQPKPTNGNGATPDPRVRWQTFVKSNGISAQDVQAALGTSKVSEWLIANNPATIDDAIELVSAAHANADLSEPF